MCAAILRHLQDQAQPYKGVVQDGLLLQAPEVLGHVVCLPCALFHVLLDARDWLCHAESSAGDCKRDEGQQYLHLSAVSGEMRRGLSLPVLVLGWVLHRGLLGGGTRFRSDGLLRHGATCHHRMGLPLSGDRVQAIGLPDDPRDRQAVSHRFSGHRDVAAHHERYLHLVRFDQRRVGSLLVASILWLAVSLEVPHLLGLQPDDDSVTTALRGLVPWKA
mmetsp:Transcript_56092/g.181972  ORF Transcript_56092/g.181972 Transcript_56092/m.181972 type:complete len:218 (-) Transcript_56092:409-1062(-)